MVFVALCWDMPGHGSEGEAFNLDCGQYLTADACLEFAALLQQMAARMKMGIAP